MNIQTFAERFDPPKTITKLMTHYLSRSILVSTSLAGISLASSVAFADPALMQPVEEIHFKELPPPWFALEKPETSGSKVKTVVSASSKPAVKQPPKPITRTPATTVSRTPKSTPTQSPIQSIIIAANKGDRHAQYDLGMRYQYGNGVKKSRSEAHRWLNKSAQAGSAQAQYALSLFYQQYARNKQGIKKALFWIKKAADQGLADAQYSLGMMFRNGSLVHKNPVKARKWIRRASIQGHVAAQLAMSN